jgi:RimJ/RimL family protein N-acetyltransferase
MDAQLKLRRGVPEDLAFILPLEAKYRELSFLGGDPPEVHRQRFSDPDCRYWIAELGGRPAGYVIMRGLASPNRNIELKRIAIADPERGLGRRVLAAIFEEVFDKLGAHRLWLDVFPHNQRAQHLYQSVGFVQEGVLRECVKFGDRYDSLILMSMLEPEYRARR